MDTDILKCIPLEEWYKLKMVFLNDWPRSLSGYTVLESEENLIEQGFDYGFKVYCPFGDVSKGMIAINTKKKLYEVIIQHATDDTADLEYALRNTKYIDWSKDIEVPFAPKHIAECIKRLVDDTNLEIFFMSNAYTFVLDTQNNFDVRLPAGFTFEVMTLEYVKQVDSVWHHRYDSSEWYYDLLTKAQSGYGLFRNKELVSWVFITEMGAFGHVYTIENHRRKGYGETVVKLVSNMIRNQRKVVFAFCDEDNVKARNMYLKLGFQNVQDVTWTRIRRK